jgi:hypothetical protein
VKIKPRYAVLTVLLGLFATYLAFGPEPTRLPQPVAAIPAPVAPLRSSMDDALPPFATQLPLDAESAAIARANELALALATTAAATAPPELVNLRIPWTRTTREDFDATTGKKTTSRPSSFIFANERVTLKCVNGSKEFTKRVRVSGTLADITVVCVTPLNVPTRAYLIRANGAALNMDSPNVNLIARVNAAEGVE